MVLNFKLPNNLTFMRKSNSSEKVARGEFEVWFDHLRSFVLRFYVLFGENSGDAGLAN